jgi:hypothetical protein
MAGELAFCGKSEDMIVASPSREPWWPERCWRLMAMEEPFQPHLVLLARTERELVERLLPVLDEFTQAEFAGWIALWTEVFEPPLGRRAARWVPTTELSLQRIRQRWRYRQQARLGAELARLAPVS